MGCFRFSLIYQSAEPAVIVLEDLALEGYATLHAPEDFETSKLIFQRLAQFHAATFLLAENVRKSFYDGKRKFNVLFVSSTFVDDDVESTLTR